MQKVFERPNTTIYASIVEGEILNLFILDKTTFIRRNFIAKTFSNFTVMRDRFIEFLKNYADSMEEGKTRVDRFNLKMDAIGTIDYIELLTEDGAGITLFHVSENGENSMINMETHLLKSHLLKLITTLENLTENTGEPQFNNLS